MPANVIQAAKELSEAVDQLKFSEPVTHVYNPLDYAWTAHESYIKKYANSHKKAIFLGMNPGPWGMAQTGVPFGEVSLIRDWVGINVPVNKPKNEHPKREIVGFECERSEVSGRRLWGLFEEKFSTAENFFKDFFVANYCPLVFMEESSRNRTPDKLPKAEVEALYDLCDEHLRQLVKALEPEWLVGIGAFAQKRAQEALKDFDVKIGKVLHPSPASPAANKGWAGKATEQLEAQGIW